MAALYQLSYRANWELITLIVSNIPVDGESKYEYYIFERRKKILISQQLYITAMINFVFMLNTLLIIGVIHVKFKSEKNSGLNKVRTHDLIDTGAVLYRLSYRAILMLRSF